ncbi:MAG: DegV family protein [Lachnospiraceae bacterium]|nr:DegV family protein [Lachnospiraceae bacterium]
MSEYYLSCCSPADLTVEHMHRRNLKYICFHFELDEVSYLDDLGQTITPAELYRKMSAGSTTKTSQVNVAEYQEYFESMLKEGKDILHVTLSSGISGTYNSACVARDALKEQYPDRTIYVLDSLAASSGYGLLMDYMADRRDEGMDIHALYAWAEEFRHRVNHWFFSTDLTFYIRGGRVSKTKGTIGNFLNICPLLNVNIEGKLIQRENIRGKKKVCHRIVEKMAECAENGTDYDGKVYLSMSACPELANDVIAQIESTFPKVSGKVELYDIGTTIGSHTGPGTVALFFIGKTKEK